MNQFTSYIPIHKKKILKTFINKKYCLNGSLVKPVKRNEKKKKRLYKDVEIKQAEAGEEKDHK